jgi:hypothetical protein
MRSPQQMDEQIDAIWGCLKEHRELFMPLATSLKRNDSGSTANNQRKVWSANLIAGLTFWEERTTMKSKPTKPQRTIADAAYTAIQALDGARRQRLGVLVRVRK